MDRRPNVVLFSEQNFVPNLPAKRKKCVNVRIENTTPNELLEIA
jgi:hypothetical protein